jgi:hypothetical protein
MRINQIFLFTNTFMGLVPFVGMRCRNDRFASGYLQTSPYVGSRMKASDCLYVIVEP